MDIKGIEGLSQQQISDEVQRGGKFVHYQYCISIVIMTFRRPTAVYFVRPGESALAKGMVYSLVSLLFGWWGIPWGPIYTISSLVTNFGGGKDVTSQITGNLR